jgi:hypothetical protein
MYFILFLGMKENSNLEDRIYKYQNQPLLYKKLKIKRERERERCIILITQHTNGAEIISEPEGT